MEDMLINHYMPISQFKERHEIFVDVPPSILLDVVTQPGVTADPWMRTFIQVREFPERLFSRLSGGGEIKNRPPFGLDNFILLGRDADREIAFGLLGKFWKPDYGLVAVHGPEEFHRFGELGVAKLVLNLSTQIMGDGRTRLATETRVFCNDRKSTMYFTPYWWLIRPISGLIRRRLLARIFRSALNISNIEKSF